MNNRMYSPGQRGVGTLIGLTPVLALAACAPLAASSGSESQVSLDPDTEMSVDCPQYLCGQNDPRLNDYRFAALNLDRKRNPYTGAALVAFEDKAGQRLQLDVTPAGEMIGTYADGQKLTGKHLIGSHIIVEFRGKHGRPLTRVIEVKGITKANHLSNEAGPLTRYWLSYGPPSNPTQMPLCKGDDISEFGALLARDELYNPKTLAIEYPVGDPRARNWVNLLCRDHALEKMKRMSYDPGRPRSDPYFTTPAERDATIKMITAAYCENKQNNSVSFTNPGTALFWQNDAGWIVHGAPPSTSLVRYELEAYWNENGAICLNKRRTENTPGDEVAHCWDRLPRCNGAPERWEWVTYVPVGPAAE